MDRKQQKITVILSLLVRVSSVRVRCICVGHLTFLAIAGPGQPYPFAELVS